MKALAEALVHAVTYINCLPDPNEDHLDEDVRMLETMAAYLAKATDEEKDALAAAAQRAFELEQGGSPRPEYLTFTARGWSACSRSGGRGIAEYDVRPNPALWRAHMRRGCLLRQDSCRALAVQIAKIVTTPPHL